ncbi:hypothetical protein GCM10010885_07130 [Alicyclobacillus cellulosilyticus]|uniref:Dihydrodipicolinate synthase/N-acetylneuraminate lyase n=1 Tax=Alicyclobacillus cellulosilyticus TaxID=1003997 RepID=A0A917K494_9BACL|nr:dihydrodipicolinate synthase family protein [Alicyclobacillus cellulosilyticus]GGJ00463.1 hypothetical protein GCM10010885_07130 [Alicyclobacillus cellulosilyticus]
MPVVIRLPNRQGELELYEAGRHARSLPETARFSSRVAFAAAHVTAHPLADVDPSSAARLDWEATLAYRRYLWGLGFGVAEAMDTAQRGMGLDWETAKELIRLSAAEAQAVGGRIACGAGTDHLRPSANVTLEDVIAAYETQCAWIERCGGQVILMASRALAKAARGPADYVRVYRRVLSQVSQPVILHWLGDMFDPALTGYFGFSDVRRAMEVCLEIIHSERNKVAGIKLSLLDADLERTMRRQLPAGVRMFTGDDFNFAELILGDETGHSDALLGIFDAIAPAAAAALTCLDRGDVDGYHAWLAPTVPLSRHIFAPPTRFYKTGVVFLAYLNGHQDHFRMVGGMESMRSVIHLAEIFRLADQAGLLRDVERAAERMRLVLAVAGVMA